MVEEQPRRIIRCRIERQSQTIPDAAIKGFPEKGRIDFMLLFNVGEDKLIRLDFSHENTLRY